MSDQTKILATAAQVLEHEGQALVRMAQNLPADFVSTVERILKIKGRIILSGIGKSGHIARKIASTLASTGTPSYFVHPAEASHGDLGMITHDDLCILLSNSGETSELGDLINHTRRFSIPLVGMSSKEDSTLMRAADFRLTLPQEPEAGSGIAPTTSTTMALALGDALAMALMEQRGFLSEHFRTYHPGGKLGAQLALVHQLMHGPEAMAVVAPDTAMQDTLLKMSEKGFGIACVVDHGKLVGVISDGDLRRNSEHLGSRTAQEVATKSPKTVPPDMMAVQALAVMNENKITVLVVVDTAGAPVGLLRIHDCLRAGVA
ncbi:KpsF/GutQ family sugar-phosphate isomerase [Sulfitobacter guttiformis]|uniref:Arabinose-5-phosphate isomerase n=1 Tax=Sulfitobacter guttiformis TaxID=74349 RepID=J7FXS9_9RHOB|nr:KpsF/GutQ family sugar-phosphate isomerase [Sulfitobacter guttiformis]AFP55425.1 arabinose 5-phosphate isomerase [Sulfitobacter guttiformis]KIN75448.1 Arabinose 5-phosphate isomerase [Sulfitobacter guttiformis KCTC 32187]RKE92047.1 arabinose-5-phosphate isomerase [Sulfitobacter guttiformis]